MTAERRILFSLLAAGLLSGMQTSPGWAAEDPTAPALPAPVEPAPAPVPAPPPAPRSERPKVRYWLDEKNKPAQPSPSGEFQADCPPAAVEQLNVQPVGNEPLVLDPATQSARDSAGRRAALKAETGAKLDTAKRAYKSGDYQTALNLAREVLTADPRNLDAAEMLRKAQGRLMDADETITRIAQEVNDRNALLEAEEHGTVPSARLPAVRPHFDRRGEDGGTARRKKMAEKLEDRVTVDFMKADLEWVLNTLFILTGVNIIADQAALEGKSLTLHVEELPLREVLNFIVRNNEGIQYSITEDAVWITASESSDLKKLMFPRIYPIHHGLVSTAEGEGMGSGSRGGGGGGGKGAGGGTHAAGTPRGRSNPGGGGGGQEEPSYLESVLKWLKEAKDPSTFPDGSDYHIDRPSSQLIVFTTPAGHEAISAFLDKFDQPPIQVRLKARFLDISDQYEKSLGANLDSLATRQITLNSSSDSTSTTPATRPNSIPFYNLTGGQQSINIPGILGNGNVFSLVGNATDPNYKISLAALLNDKSTKVLSEPSILAISGKKANIDITTQFSYITDLREVTTTDSAGTGTTVSRVSAFVPEFENDEIGFSLMVTPSVGRDLKTINMHLNPVIDSLHPGQDITQFQQFEVTQTQGQSTTPPVIKRPTIDNTSLETDVVVEDNGYVIIGGLIRASQSVTERKVPGLSKIPYLGNLFKSKATTRERHNLMVIVEAQIVTPGGRTYYKDPDADDMDVRQGGAPHTPGRTSEISRPDAVSMALGLPVRRPLPGAPAPVMQPAPAPRVKSEPAAPARKAASARHEDAAPRGQMEQLKNNSQPATAQWKPRSAWVLPAEAGEDQTEMHKGSAEVLPASQE